MTSGGLEIMEELRRALWGAKKARDVWSAVNDLAKKHWGSARVILWYANQRLAESDDVPPALPLLIKGDQLLVGDVPLSLPLFVSDTRRARLPAVICQALFARGLCSFALLPIYGQGRPAVVQEAGSGSEPKDGAHQLEPCGQASSAAVLCGILEFQFAGRYQRWRSREVLLFQQAAEMCGLHLQRLGRQTVEERFQTESRRVAELQAQYQRLARYGNLLLVCTDRELGVREIAGDTEAILGLSRAELLADRAAWVNCIHPSDLRRLISRSRRARPRELGEEIRVIHQKSGAVRWLILRAVPYFSLQNEFAGWEGCGVDITEKHEAQEQLVLERRRIEALYAVARALQSTSDPALVTLQGLRALLKATKSDCGLGYLYDSAAAALEIAAAEGLSPAYLEELSRCTADDELLAQVVAERKGLLIDDLQLESRALMELARQEGLRSTIMTPLLSEKEVLGVIVLSRRRASRYAAADFDLVSAASNQIALAARQAALYAAEKRQANSLAALYRLSHELSKQVTLKEVIDHAFPVIQEELACKRMWLGVVNERGTHIAGQAGFGPGIRQNVIDIQIELNRRHDFLDQALRKKQPVIVEAGQPMECSGLNRIMNRLQCGTFVIVPLVALGQVVGVLVVEPAVASAFFAQRKLPLLNSMASEMATVILARRFESRMADADKMRMAGLMASGIAHNFNNLLQAVMGQASLIEMQCGRDSRLGNSARMIIEAASRGAALVRQLFDFSSPERFALKRLDLKRLLSDSRDLYRSALGSNIALEIKLEEGAAEIMGDATHLQQVFTNLLVNAREAIGAREGGRVKISACQVRLRSGEVDPELAPGVYWRVDFEDNGVGMDAEQQARCFEPFFTTKNIDARTGLGFGGSGLGLSTAYSIMKQHAGLITVRSAPGQGSTFCLYIPAAEQKVRTADVRAEAEREEPVQALIYNLEESAVLTVKSALEAWNVPLLSGVPLEKLADYLRERPQIIPLVIMDLDKPGFKFSEFLGRVRAVSPQSRFIVACSDRNRWQSVLSGLKSVQLMEKPPALWAMNTVLRRVMEALPSQSLAKRVEKEVLVEKEMGALTPLAKEERRLMKESN